MTYGDAVETRAAGGVGEAVEAMLVVLFSGDPARLRQSALIRFHAWLFELLETIGV